MWSTYFAVVWSVYGIVWPLDLLLGTSGVAAIASVLLSYVAKGCELPDAEERLLARVDAIQVPSVASAAERRPRYAPRASPPKGAAGSGSGAGPATAASSSATCAMRTARPR